MSRAVLVVTQEPIVKADLQFLDAALFQREPGLNWDLRDYRKRKLGETIPISKLVYADILKVEAVVVEGYGWFPAFDPRADVEWLKDKGLFASLCLLDR